MENQKPEPFEESLKSLRKIDEILNPKSNSEVDKVVGEEATSSSPSASKKALKTNGKNKQ